MESDIESKQGHFDPFTFISDLTSKAKVNIKKEGGEDNDDLIRWLLQ